MLLKFGIYAEEKWKRRPFIGHFPSSFNDFDIYITSLTFTS